ncbi:MAG: IclR family transcriptional regulator [Acidimicrobiia bacterium]|nr:IclR family transcriptional regulator [Acidimicrobiia bacterium]
MSTVQSIERAFGIMRVLAVGPAGVTELAGQVSLPKSTVARLLATLEGVGAVERTEAGQYRIGPTMWELSGHIDALAGLVVAVRPHLELLTERHHEASGFSVPDGYSVRYLTQVESPNPVQVRDYSGLVLPMHVGPAGLVMMAEWPQQEVAHYLARPLVAFTASTITDPAQIEKRLGQIRTDGYAWVHEEYAEGISSVAAPVFDSSGAIRGAIHMHGPTYRFPQPGTTEAIGADLAHAAAVFSERRAASIR